MTAPDLDALERLLEAATPGPWKVCPDERDDDVPEDERMLLVCCGPGDEHAGPVCTDPLTEADARLIAAARNALPALLATARRQRRYKQALEQFAWCDLNDDNCASLEVASRRIRHLARAALAEEGQDG